MITLLGSILGFATSFIPKLLEMQQSKIDHKHEMEMAQFQLESQVKLAGIKMEEAQINVDAEQMRGIYANAAQSMGYHWVEALNGTVRPIITYTYFLLITYIELALIMHLSSAGLDIMHIKSIILDDDVMGLFATILSFWFGHRTMKGK